jgi:DNA repair protein RecN (Recombination protein N)
MTPLLSLLRIRNLALVEELVWELHPGFTCVTGETGSGKSIILGALKLLVGERADKSLIRAGTDSCTVEAVFDCTPEGLLTLNHTLETLGVEPCENAQLLIKRVLLASGNNRQFINGSPTTLQALKHLGDSLIDLHGPHDHQSLLSPDLQRSLLDHFSGCSAPLTAYTETFARLTHIQRELDSLCGDDATFERECALLSHQTQEIEAAALRPEEEPELYARYRVASQGKKIGELLAGLQARLRESESPLIAQVSELLRPLRELERLDPATAPLLETLQRASSELDSLSEDLQRYANSLDLDPRRLVELEDRVNLLESLKRKYGGSVEAVLEFGRSAALRLEKLSSRSEERQLLEKQIASLQQNLEGCGKQLSAARTAAAPKLADSVARHLADLGLGQSKFSIALEPLPRPSPHGEEAIEFLFAPNPGEPPKPLRLIASSGEMSRIMLALKSALTEQDPVAVLVFDEIDANVGGEIAHAVGEKMAALGQKRQVLTISHLPQVASKATQHFVVCKTYANGKTLSQLQKVGAQDRIEEIARMLGGKTQSALALAQALLAPPVPSVPEPAPPKTKADRR